MCRRSSLNSYCTRIPAPLRPVESRITQYRGVAVTAECINDLKKREIPAFGGRIREWAEGAIHIGLPNQDRDGVAGGQEYEVEYFARKHGITAEQARQLIKEQRKWP